MVVHVVNASARPSVGGRTASIRDFNFECASIAATTNSNPSLTVKHCYTRQLNQHHPLTTTEHTQNQTHHKTPHTHIQNAPSTARAQEGTAFPLTPFLPTPSSPVKSNTNQPRKQQYLDKRVEVQLNGSRKVMGTLRGYDVFLNIVLDEATESKPNNEKVRLGMCVIRGNAVVMLEALDRIDTDNRNRG